ncbi:MAG: MarR family transcriptional regulator [Oscillospiraceae bacterium]|nr:MarR family transcriptional regulator [Oscillospiraceae bacterium]
MKTTNNNSLMIRSNDYINAVNEASYLYGEFVCREMERIGMKLSYRHVLKPLMEHDSLTQLQLVKITGLKAPTISISLRNMERDGLVRRDKKTDCDRRETHVCITDKGKKMYAKVLEILGRAEKTMLKGISKSELKAMRGTLDKMIANFNEKNTKNKK